MGYHGRISLTVDRRVMITGMVAALATGCSQLQSIIGAADSIKKVAEDVGLISSGLAPVVAQITQLLPADTVSKVTAALDVVSKGAAELNTAVSIPAGQTTVQKIANAANAIISVAAPLLAGTPYGQTLLAVQALLPVVQGAVGLFVAQAGPTGVSPDQARAILRRRSAEA